VSVLERWTGGRIKATEHRVIGPERERFSIPFFYEPRVDARIAPLPLPGIAPFEPFLYGDHLWAAMMRFVEFRGLGTIAGNFRFAPKANWNPERMSVVAYVQDPRTGRVLQALRAPACS